MTIDTADNFDYLCGRDAYHAWTNSPYFAGYDHSIPARDVMRIFLPPVPESMTQMAQPLPKSYREWIRGFEDAKNGINKC